MEPVKLGARPPPDELVPVADPLADLQSESNWVRYRATRALAHPKGPLLEPLHAKQLAEVLVGDGSRLVRHGAALAICRLGPEAAAQAGALARALSDEEMIVRRDAARAFAGAGSVEVLKTHIQALLGAVEDAFWPVRYWVCRALVTVCRCQRPGRTGKVLLDSRPAEMEGIGNKLVSVAIGDQEVAVREVAAGGLSSMPVEEAMPFVHWLTTQVVSREGELGDRAVVALATVLQGPSGHDGRIQLANVARPLLQRAHEDAAGATTAAHPGGPKRWDPTRSLLSLEDKNPKVRQEALQNFRHNLVRAGQVSQNIMVPVVDSV